MRETVTYIENIEGKILNIDVKADNTFLAITDKKEVVTSSTIFTINGEVHFPIIRELNSKEFLIANLRNKNDNENAFIYDFNGNLKTKFKAGDGIEDIVINADKIVITYFDEGVFGDDGYNNNGLSIFDFNGNFQFGFNQNQQGLVIHDCYCICKIDDRKIAFYAYDFFNVIELDLNDFTITKLETPNIFEGANAMSKLNNKYIFHSSYYSKNEFFEWNLSNNSVKKIGEYNSTLKGLLNGSFLAFGDSGFTIIETSS